jgi:hypothetical protein
MDGPVTFLIGQHPNTSHPAEPELPGLAVRFTDEEAR